MIKEDPLNYLDVHVNNLDNSNRGRRTKYEYLNMIDEYSSRLGLPVNSYAKDVFNKCYNMYMARIYGVRLLSLASIYASIRIKGIPLTLNEFVDRLELDRDDRRRISRLSRKIYRAIGSYPSIIDVDTYISKICNDLNLPGEIYENALEIYRGIKPAIKTIGSSRSSIAYACIYLAFRVSGKPITYMELQEITNNNGIANVVRRILKHLSSRLDADNIDELVNRILSP